MGGVEREREKERLTQLNQIQKSRSRAGAKKIEEKPDKHIVLGHEFKMPTMS